MRCTMSPDTNVVVAASVCGVSEMFGTVVAVPRHGESRRLLAAGVIPDGGRIWYQKRR